MMRAAVIDGRESMTIAEVPTPEPHDGEVRIRVGYVGICGSDLHYYYQGANGENVVREPLVPGHELSGWVDVDPSGARRPGTPVTVHPARFGTPRAGLEREPHLWPGGSYLGSAGTMPHTQGAMGDFLIVEERMLRELPATLPVRRAALAEPLGVALHAVERAGSISRARVLVSGAGPIGILVAAAASRLGAGQVTVSDVRAEPLERARGLGVDDTVVIGRAEPAEDAFDVVFECSAAPQAVSAAARAVRSRGTVVQVGMLENRELAMNLAPLVSKEAQLVGTLRFVDEIDAAVALLDSDPDFDRVVTHEFALDDAVEAFATARDATRSGKVLVRLAEE